MERRRPGRTDDFQVLHQDPNELGEGRAPFHLSIRGGSDRTKMLSHLEKQSHN
jgi:hypothetical protein